MEQNNYLVFQNIVHFYYQRLINGIQTVCFLPAVVDNTPSFSAWIWILYYFVPFVYFRSCYYQQRFALVYGSMEDPALTLTLPASALLRDSLRFLLAPASVLSPSSVLAAATSLRQADSFVKTGACVPSLSVMSFVEGRFRQCENC